MEDLKVFKKDGIEVRVTMKDNEPWFVAKDVCSVLGYRNTSKAVHDHIDLDERYNAPLERGGSLLLISESGLYTLIMRSKKSQAKKFKRWVTGEVLPSIRKHGAYMTSATLEKALTSPDFLIELATKLKEERALREAAEHKTKELQPKAEYFDMLVDRNLLTNFRDTAKELQMGQKELIEKLLKGKYIFRNIKGELKPYMNYVEEGLFELKEWANDSKAGLQTLVTPKGRETFRLLLII